MSEGYLVVWERINNVPAYETPIYNLFLICWYQEADWLLLQKMHFLIQASGTHVAPVKAKGDRRMYRQI